MTQKDVKFKELKQGDAFQFYLTGPKEDIPYYTIWVRCSEKAILPNLAWHYPSLRCCGSTAISHIRAFDPEQKVSKLEDWDYMF